MTDTDMATDISPFTQFWNGAGPLPENLGRHTLAHPLIATLFKAEAPDVIVNRQARCWHILTDALQGGMTRQGWQNMSPADIWFMAIPLAHYILHHPAKIIGLTGAPGIGKSTLAAALSALMRLMTGQENYLNVSLDDFYLPKPERLKRGLKWRAPPGSHDVEAAASFLQAVQEGRKISHIPTFNSAADDRGPDRIINCKIEKLIFDGWFLGFNGDGYDALNARVDFLIFFDSPIEFTRARRFARESAIRASAGVKTPAGFSQSQMEAFWLEILEPGIEAWVKPARDEADLILNLDGSGKLGHAALKS